MLYRIIATLGQRMQQRGHGRPNQSGMLQVMSPPRAKMRLSISARSMGSSSSSPSPTTTGKAAPSSQQVEKESLATDTAAADEKPQEATGWLKRMAPPKGGTEVPDAKFMAVATIVTGAGFYAWFIDAPTPS